MTQFNTYNYIVPAAGTTHGHLVSREFDATPHTVDFRNIQLDGLPFIPSGFFADNTRGTGDLVIVINEIAFQIVIPAGEFAMMQYPAPTNQSVSIVGEGKATVVFVDFPVIPFRMGPAGGAPIDYTQQLDTIAGNITDLLTSSEGTLLNTAAIVTELELTPARLATQTDAIAAAVTSQTTALNTARTAQTTALNNARTAQTTALNNAAATNAAGIVAAIETQTVALSAKLDAVIAALTP